MIQNNNNSESSVHPKKVSITKGPNNLHEKGPPLFIIPERENQGYNDTNHNTDAKEQIGKGVFQDYIREQNSQSEIPL